LGGEDAIARVCGEVEVLNEAAHKEHGAFKAVGVLVVVGNGIFDEVFEFVNGWERVVETFAAWGERVAAAKGDFEEAVRPDAVVMRFPETVAAISFEPLHASFTAFSALDHALDGFEGVEVVGVDAAVADADGFG